MEHAAGDADFRQDALRSALGCTRTISVYRDGRNARYRSEGGVDPVAIRAAVLAKDGHPMTPLPDGLERDAVHHDVGDGRALVRCPIWTTGGQSGWEMTVECERQASGFIHARVMRLTHLANFESDVVDACEHIGAHAHAEVFRRIRDLLPVAARGAWQGRQDHILTLADDGGNEDPQWRALERELDALDDVGASISKYMLDYVESHPDEFFLG